MRQRALELLRKVPDVKIRNAADGSDSDDDSKFGDAAGTRSISGFESIQDTSMTDNGPKSPSAFPDSENVSVRDDEEEFDIPGFETEQDQLQKQFMTDQNLFIKKWKQKTFTIRARILKERIEQYRLPFGERDALERTEAKVAQYLHQEKLYLRRMSLRKEMVNAGKHIDEDDTTFNSFHLPELVNFNSSVPLPLSKPCKTGDVAVFLMDEELSSMYIPPPPLPTLSEYKQFQVDMTSTLNKCFVKNVAEFKAIKDIHTKIINNVNVIAAESYIPYRSTVPHHTPFQYTHSEENLPPAVLNSDATAHVMKQTCTWIAAHVGYDSASAQTMHTLNDLAQQYMIHLGKTLKQYMDRREERSASDVLLHVLNENGVSDPVVLDSYIRQNVVRHGEKLQRLRQKLESALNYLQKEEDVDMEQNNEGLMRFDVLIVVETIWMNWG